MNAQIRYGFACLLAAVLLVGITAMIFNGGDSLSHGAYDALYLIAFAGWIAAAVGIVLLIVGLVRKPRSVRPPQA